MSTTTTKPEQEGGGAQGEVERQEALGPPDWLRQVKHQPLREFRVSTCHILPATATAATVFLSLLLLPLSALSSFLPFLPLPPAIKNAVCLLSFAAGAS